MQVKGIWPSLALVICFLSPSYAAEPELLLLSKYRPEMAIDGWYMSEKLDGVRAYWNGRQLLSRQGNVIAAPDWFIERLPHFELDGELWSGRGRFAETLSITSHHQPESDWQHITYNIFEVPNAPGGLQKRLHRLHQYLQQQAIPHLRIIPQTVCRDSTHLLAELDRLNTAGAEGLVLRNPNSPYETGRSPNALKVKHFDDMEGRVVGYRPGKGKYSGMTGALWVEIEDQKRFYIGSGLTDKERLRPPGIGSLVTFRYQGYTKNGIPRFATYLRVRVEPE